MRACAHPLLHFLLRRALAARAAPALPHGMRALRRTLFEEQHHRHQASRMYLALSGTLRWHLFVHVSASISFVIADFALYFVQTTPVQQPSPDLSAGDRRTGDGEDMFVQRNGARWRVPARCGSVAAPICREEELLPVVYACMTWMVWRAAAKKEKESGRCGGRFVTASSDSPGNALNSAAMAACIRNAGPAP